MSSTLLEATLSRYVNRPRTLTIDKIAADTGLSTHWLVQLSTGRTVEPGVTKIQTLYEYLTGKKLEV